MTEGIALAASGHAVRVEAGVRPASGDRGETGGLRVDYLDDAPLGARLRALARVVVRHPYRSLRDLAGRRRWRAQEAVWPLRSLAPAVIRAEREDAHLHAHFAAAAGLNALRIGRLAGLPYSVVAHGYDIYQRPMNLPEKLERSAFAAGTCDYTVEHLRTLVPAASRKRINRIVMGVEGSAFSRTGPLPGTRRVVAVGRLVEKKGFEVLIRAAALLADTQPLDKVVIAGDGPLRPYLEALVSDLGVEGTVTLAGPMPHPAVQALLESADLLTMPCVVAADGDRDSMPVVVKEALAMEILVAASDEVGLPEMVMPPWGRLAAPGDAVALAGAIDGLLGMSPPDRADAGRAGREFVLKHCNPATEAKRLSGLIAEAAL
ncbi:MAG: hypothetical protein QOG62_1733 [Thermoleophilaceae bacterium]|nr:hypothetical protein [Thermoleophilaceae bacterium]